MRQMNRNRDDVFVVTTCSSWRRVRRVSDTCSNSDSERYGTFRTFWLSTTTWETLFLHVSISEEKSLFEVLKYVSSLTIDIPIRFGIFWFRNNVALFLIRTKFLIRMDICLLWKSICSAHVQSMMRILRIITNYWRFRSNQFEDSRKRLC